MTPTLRNICVLIALCIIANFLIGSSVAAPQALSAESWREDLMQLRQSIIEAHPQPFENISESEFNSKVESLSSGLHELNDKTIILEMASIVSELDDGHTRLFIPRVHRNLGFIQGHTGTEPPKFEDLKFNSLPLVFSLFEEGLFVTGAVEGFESHIGDQVLSIGGMSVEDAIKAVRPTMYAENDSAIKMLAPDRLSLPEVLAHYGVIDDEQSTPISFKKNDGSTYSVAFGALPNSKQKRVVFMHEGDRPLNLQNPDIYKWHAPVPNEKEYYIQIDMTEQFPEQLMIEFIVDAVEAAENQQAEKLIIDLRENQGGWGIQNAAIVNTLARSTYNQYGKLFVLIGRKTFSSAQMLVNELQQYTNVIFVGEKTGSKPSHFGDARKTQLGNSGLTLRVSTLYWPSWLANDFRDGTGPHIAAPPSAKTYFSGGDKAIEASLDYSPPIGAAEQVEELFRKGFIQNGVIRFVSYLADPGAPTFDIGDDMVARGLALLEEGFTREGYFMMVLARDYYVQNSNVRYGLGRAQEKLGEKENAIKRYEEALELDPTNRDARRALNRLRQSLN